LPRARRRAINVESGYRRLGSGDEFVGLERDRGVDLGDGSGTNAWYVNEHARAADRKLPDRLPNVVPRTCPNPSVSRSL